MNQINRRIRIAAIVIMTSVLAAKSALPQSAEQYRQMGLAYRGQERYPEAIAAFQKSVELEPDTVSGRVLLGWTQHRAGQHTEAAATLEQALSLNPFHVQTLNALGIVYLVSGHLAQAVTAHGWAAYLKPDNEIAHYNLSLALERLRQYEWAIATAQEAARLEPTNPHPFVALAIAYLGNGQPLQAQQAYRQAITVDPRYNDSGFLNYLNEAGFSSDQIERSKQVLRNLG